MRTLFLCFIALLAAVSASAQEHLSFKGIPIEGSVVSFCQKLKAKGYTQIAKQQNTTFLSGDFTGLKATVGVVASEETNNVFGVMVFFDPSTEWNVLTSTYEHYKALYTRKYGQPTVVEESIPERSNSNTCLMYNLNQGLITYRCVWNVTGGEIEVLISNYSDIVDKGMVNIAYRDAINIAEKQNKDLEDI